MKKEYGPGLYEVCNIEKEMKLRDTKVLCPGT